MQAQGPRVAAPQAAAQPPAQPSGFTFTPVDDKGKPTGPAAAAPRGQEGIFTEARRRGGEGLTKIGRAISPNSDVQNLWGIPGSGRVGSAVAGVGDILSSPLAPIGYAGSRGSQQTVNDQALDARIARAEKLKREHPGAAGADPDVNALPYLKQQRAIPEAERIRQDQERARSLAEDTTAVALTVAGAANPGWFSGPLLRSAGTVGRSILGAERGVSALRPSVANAAREVQASLGGQVARTGGHTIETLPIPNRSGTQQVLNEAERILTGGARGNQRTLEAAQELQTGRGPLALGEVGKRRAAQRGTYQPEPLETTAKQIVRPTEEVLAPVEQQFIERLERGAKPVGAEAASPLRAVGKEKQTGIVAEAKGLVAPHALGQEAEETSRRIIRTMGEQAFRRERNRGLMAESEKVLDRLPKEARIDFINRFERGAAQATPELDTLAAGLKSATETKWKEVQAVVPKAADIHIEHYLPHYYEDAAKARDVFGRGAAVEGGKGFLKERQIPTYEVAKKLGLKPKDDNAVRITLQRLDDMDQMLTGHEMLRHLEKEGMLTHTAGGKEIPAGYEKLPGSFPLGGEVAVPHDVAQVFKNYLGGGLRAAAPKTYENIRKAGAIPNMMQLGFSPFHLLATMINSMGSQGALGLRQVVSQGMPLAERARGVGNIITSPLAPLRDYATGWSVRKAYRYGTGNPRIAKQIENIINAGQRTSMQQADLLSKRGQALDLAVRAIRRKEYGEAAKHSPFAIIEAGTAPIMRDIVPKIKQGSFARLAEFEMRRLGPNASEQDIMKALQRAGNTVDDRFGQFVYDNQGWNKVIRDVAFLTVRAPGWTYGTLRHGGGAVADTAKLVTGRPGAQFSDRMAFWPALAANTALLGAMWQYAHTGEWPKTLRDYYYPKNGGHDENGNPTRDNLPTYITRDVVSWTRHPMNTALGKLHPLVQMLTELEQGTTFGPKGSPEAIYNTHDSYGRMASDVIEYIAKQLVPIGWRQQRPTKEGATPRSGLSQRLGISPAPREMERTDEENAAAEARTPYGRAVAARKKRERLDAGEEE